MAAGRWLLGFVVALVLAAPPRAAWGLPSLMAESGSEPASVAGSLIFILRGAYRSDGLRGREVFGLLELSVPLDRFVAQTPGREQTSDEETPDSPQTEAQPAGKQPARKLVVKLTPELARDTVRAALRAAGDHHSRARLVSIASRARSSAVLPELRLRAARSTDQTLRLTPTDSDPYRYTQSGGTDLAFEARLTWKLDRLVFADQELGVERIRGQRATARARLARDVLRTLFAWQRAELRRRDPELSPEQQTEAALRALEALVTLDLLTAGWFSERVAPPARTD